MDKISIFTQIRNKPYHISTKGEVGTACADKAYELIASLSQIGIESRLIIGLMKWSELELPSTVTQIPHEDDSSHAFVEVQNSNGDWIIVDSTWNPELKNAGFPIAEWDGENSTSLAIKCHKIFSAQDSQEYLKTIDNNRDLAINGKFYEAINKYCDSFKE